MSGKVFTTRGLSVAVIAACAGILMWSISASAISGLAVAPKSATVNNEQPSTENETGDITAEDGEGTFAEEREQSVAEPQSMMTDEARDITGEEFAAGDYQGLYYHVRRYDCDCKIIYLKEYVAFLEKKSKAATLMHELGDITKAELLACRAEQKEAEAALTVAENERDYYQLYLEEHALDFSTFDVTKAYKIYDVEYYRENYPEREIMTMAGYVMNYHNATANIKAKQAELAALKEKVSAAEQLFAEGELSELDLEQQRMVLAEGEYELQQYYVERALAYCSLKMLD